MVFSQSCSDVAAYATAPANALRLSASKLRKALTNSTLYFDSSGYANAYSYLKPCGIFSTIKFTAAGACRNWGLFKLLIAATLLLIS
ncbi:unnamed protein product [Leptosia nina]|uniref:Uncharacterized protein n=1 Tax=Leptosia nina TaxID=320188 RepID=A0AAV1JF44_9NEOP